MICDSCKVREAKVYQPHSGRRLCAECFKLDIKDRVRTESIRLGLHKSSKILLAVSGGKDSFVLVDTLSSFIEPSRLVALTVVEGIRGYNRADQAQKLSNYMRERGVELLINSFKERTGFSLDEMMGASKAKGLNYSACTFCGGFRRKLINEVAREVKAELVVTGHNLDDEVQTLIINVIRGDLTRLVRLGEIPLRVSDKFVTRVKPLRRIYEWETTTYAYLSGYEFQEAECPYISNSPTLRSKVRELLYELSLIHI